MAGSYWLKQGLVRRGLRGVTMGVEGGGMVNQDWESMTGSYWLEQGLVRWGLQRVTIAIEGRCPWTSACYIRPSA